MKYASGAAAPPEYMVLESQAHAAWLQRDYNSARHLAGRAATSARRTGDDKAWWGLLFLQTQCLKREGLLGEVSSTGEKLRSHPLTSGSRSRTARLSTLLAGALTEGGRLEAATAEARRAVEASDHANGTPDERIRSRHALIAALAESDRTDDAWRECQRLAGLLAPYTSAEMLGKTYWVFGNVAYLMGDTRSGKEYHSQAAGYLTHHNDLHVWARFNQASAALRLAGGAVEPETLECIERAELTARILGQNERQELELSLTRASWLFQTGQFDAAAGRLRSICRTSSVLAPQTAAEAHSLLGRVLSHLGRSMEGLLELETGKELFEQAGAPVRAARVGKLIDEIHP